MGQKVHPKSLRLKINTSWESTWYASKKNYSKHMLQDISLREQIMKKFADAALSKVEIGRVGDKIQVVIYTGKPGLIIGRQGTQIDEFRSHLSQKYGSVDITVKEIKKPDIDARIVGEGIARQIEKRIPYRRASKQAVSRAIQSGAKGVKIRVSGRLNGAEIARSEEFKEGNIPLHTLRAIIDYAEIRANTTYGVIGIKVWVYKGESFKNKKADQE